jgi:multisubunit Na+/H+ antiporter MnhG subunit
MAEGYGPDLRILIGWLFAIFGAILTVFGLFRQDAFAPLTRSNVNLQWGIVLLVFGAVMLALGYRREAASKREEARQTPTIR